MTAAGRNGLSKPAEDQVLNIKTDTANRSLVDNIGAMNRMVTLTLVPLRGVLTSVAQTCLPSLLAAYFSEPRRNARQDGHLFGAANI